MEGRLLLDFQQPDYHSVIRRLRPSALRPRLLPGLLIALLICCFWLLLPVHLMELITYSVIMVTWFLPSRLERYIAVSAFLMRLLTEFIPNIRLLATPMLSDSCISGT
jgi:hypothetical protein